MQNKINSSLLDVLVVFIIATSTIAIISLMLSRFNAFTSVISGTILTLSIFWASKNKSNFSFSIKNNTHLLPIIMLLLIGLFFRSEPYLFIAGGQDQGVYVNMSKYYEKYGKTLITDNVRANLPEDLIKKYDSFNINTIHHHPDNLVKNQFESSYLPGVYVKNQSDSTYVFQFYHLHPLWMSIFGKSFGDLNRIYSLVFFSLISIVAFYLLAFEFTRRKDIAFIAGALLAINPLHTFFSKYPATEIVAFSFTTLSFYYLLKYYNLARENKHFPGHLVISALLIAGMFFTRISGFMYLPFFYLILISVHIYIDDELLKKQLKIYVYSVFILYAASVIYGLNFSYPYSKEIYSSAFSPIFGINWKTWMLLLAGLWVIVHFLILNISKSSWHKGLKDFISGSRSFIPYIILIITCIGLYKVYQLGFTEHYIHHALYDLRFNAAGTGWNALLYWSVFVTFEYLSPFIFIIFWYILITQTKNNNAPRTMLVLFLTFFFAYISLLQWFIPFQYYYARYLVSEAVPFILLFTVIGIDRLTKTRNVAYLLLILSAAYMLYFSFTQFNGKEMQGFRESLDEIKKHVGESDIVILDRRLLYFVYEIKTPLVFYYNYNVLSVDKHDDEKFINHFCNKDNNVYFFNENRKNNYAKLIKTIWLRTEIFEHTNKIPTEIIHTERPYYLSKVSCVEFIDDFMKKTHTLYTQGKSLGIINGFHDDKIWSADKANITNINTSIDGNKYLVLETFGYDPRKGDINKLNLKLEIASYNLDFIKYENNKYYFLLPNIKIVENLQVSSNTFIPGEIGSGQDTRKLGIDIKSIQLVKEIK